MTRKIKTIVVILLFISFSLTACSIWESTLPSTERPMIGRSIVNTATDTPPPTVPTPTPTSSPTSTPTPTITNTPTITLTPSITPTATFDFPDGILMMNAFCRYGPGTAYLYSHALYTDEHVSIQGRNYDGTWLWVFPDTLDRRCWVSASVLEIEGDIFSVSYYQSALPFTTFIGPPQNVQAVRNGDQVVVSWNDVNMQPPEDARGYLIEAVLCQNGFLIDVAVHTDVFSYTFFDQQTCDQPSSGLLYTVEKHGYTDSVQIPWP